MQSPRRLPRRGRSSVATFRGRWARAGKKCCRQRGLALQELRDGIVTDAALIPSAHICHRRLRRFTAMEWPKFRPGQKFSRRVKPEEERTRRRPTPLHLEDAYLGHRLYQGEATRRERLLDPACLSHLTSLQSLHGGSARDGSVCTQGCIWPRPGSHSAALAGKDSIFQGRIPEAECGAFARGPSCGPIEGQVEPGGWSSRLEGDTSAVRKWRDRR